MILVILSSVLEILANPPFSLYFLSFVFLVPFFIFLLKEERFWRLLRGTLLWKLIFLLGSLYYGFDFLLTFLKLLPFLGFPIFVFIVKRYIDKNNTVAHLLLIGAGLLIFDYAFNHAWLSFLAANIGTSLASSTFLGLASFGGLWGLSIFTVIINCIIAYAYLRYEAHKNVKEVAYAAGILVIILITAAAVSQIVLKKNKENYESRKNTLTFTSISSDKNFDEVLKNIPTVVNEKDVNFVEQFIHQRFAIIKRNLVGRNTDLIIFPEDMIIAETWNYADTEAREKFGITSSKFLIEAFRDVAKTQNAHVLTNLTLMKNGGRYNTELLFNPAGEIVDLYDKNNLVIGGETWPFGNWHPFYFDLVGKYNPASPRNTLKPIFYPEYRYTPGEDGHILTVGKVNIGTLICAEILYPERAKDYAERGADILLHSASNNWVSVGLDAYRAYILNLHKIEAVWLSKPIILTGINDYAGLTLPDGTFEGVDYRSSNEGFVIYTGVVHF